MRIFGQKVGFHAITACLCEVEIPPRVVGHFEGGRRVSPQKTTFVAGIDLSPPAGITPGFEADFFLVNDSPFGGNGFAYWAIIWTVCAGLGAIADAIAAFDGDFCVSEEFFHVPVEHVEIEVAVDPTHRAPR